MDAANQGQDPRLQPSRRTLCSSQSVRSPYNDINPIGFEGDILVTLDSISELTLIGFDSEETDVWSVFNDTTRNSLTTVNVVDCKFERLEFDQPKTSLYLSYSTVDYVYFSHGDIIGNHIRQLLAFGNQDFDALGSSAGVKSSNFYYDHRNLMGSSNHLTTCELFQTIVPFGFPTPSDTCNIIANDFKTTNGYGADIVLHSTDFAFNVKNNKFPQQANDKTISIYLACPDYLGVNQIVNNSLSPAPQSNSNNNAWWKYGVSVKLASCNNGEYNVSNFDNVKLNILNNTCWSVAILASPTSPGYSSANFDGESVSAYNYSSWVSGSGNVDGEDMFAIGPSNYDGSNPNPSDAFLNLDLTTNTIGVNGGSDAWSNYHSGSEAGFGTLTGSKRRASRI